MKRSGPLERKTPLKRTGGLKRSAMARAASPLKRVAVNPVSARKRRLDAERRVVIADLRTKVKHCEARPLLRAALARMTTDAGRAPYLEALRSCAIGAPLVGHEPQKRSRRGSTVDPANIMLVSQSCNDWVERFPDAATEAGLLIPSSFERDGRA